MFSKDLPFFLRSKQVAEDFLQTTVIVDDQAIFDVVSDEKKGLQPVLTEELKIPSRKARATLDSKSIKETGISTPAPVSRGGGSHVLDAQKVINTFAQKRIVCSVIKPSRDYDWQSSVEKLAINTDIIILDWELDKDSGEKTLNLLKKILKAAHKAPAQLRLLAIYTGEPGIVGIAAKIKSLIVNDLKIDVQKLQEQDSGFALVYASTRIVIFSKPGTTSLPPEYIGRKVEFDELADRVTAEFTEMTAGLVSNVAINSLALIRNNTFKILNSFSTYLDAPYLTHRALQVNPEDAEELLTELVAEEIRAILEEESVGSGANIEVIREWLLATRDANVILRLDDQISFTITEIVNLLSSGINDCVKISRTKRTNPHKLPLTEMFKPQELFGQALDERFSLLTIIRTHYQKKKPKLTFGTILQKVRDKRYWVCMQPRCDSVRIESERAFPVLPLEISGADQKFRLVLMDENTSHIRVSLADKPYGLNLIKFMSRAEDHGTIIAKSEKGNYYFTSTNRVKYRWVGELRTEQAQRLANEFAANLSRVGLDESEWLRLWATKG